MLSRKQFIGGGLATFFAGIAAVLLPSKATSITSVEPLTGSIMLNPVIGVAILDSPDAAQFHFERLKNDPIWHVPRVIAIRRDEKTVDVFEWDGKHTGRLLKSVKAARNIYS